MSQPMTKEQLKAIRAKTGLSQARFAKLYGLNRRTYERWEMQGVDDQTAIAYLAAIEADPNMLAVLCRNNATRRLLYERPQRVKIAS